MALPPQKFREIVVQILYSQDVTESVPELVPFMMETLKVARHYVAEAESKVQSIAASLKEIDEYIQKSSTNYSFDRISRMEKTILRLGVYELLHEPTLPPKVVLAEAVRLCRKFGTQESAQFVNAVLDSIYSQHILVKT